MLYISDLWVRHGRPEPYSLSRAVTSSFSLVRFGSRGDIIEKKLADYDNSFLIDCH